MATICERCGAETKKMHLALTRDSSPRGNPSLPGIFCQPGRLLSLSLPRFARACAPDAAHIARAQFSLALASASRASRGADKERSMSIGSIGGTSSLNQAYLSQQAQSVLAASFDPQTTAAGTSAAATGSTDASSNTLTGVNTPTLDSQTLQALMDLTQQDPAAASDPSSTDGSGQASQGVRAVRVVRPRARITATIIMVRGRPRRVIRHRRRPRRMRHPQPMPSALRRRTQTATRIRWRRPCPRPDAAAAPRRRRGALTICR